MCETTSVTHAPPKRASAGTRISGARDGRTLAVEFERHRRQVFRRRPHHQSSDTRAADGKGFFEPLAQESLGHVRAAGCRRDVFLRKTFPQERPNDFCRARRELGRFQHGTVSHRSNARANRPKLRAAKVHQPRRAGLEEGALALDVGGEIRNDLV